MQLGIRDAILDVSLYSHVTMKDKPEEGNCDGRLVVLDEAYNIVHSQDITWLVPNFPLYLLILSLIGAI